MEAEGQREAGRCYGAGFGGRERSHEARNTGGSKAGKVRKQISVEPFKGASPANALTLAPLLSDF